MKKSILTIALMAIVSLTASAVSIDWNTTALSFNGSVLKNDTNVTGYLIALSGDTLSTYTVDNVFSATSIGALADTQDAGTPKSGKLTDRFVFAYPTYENGDSFALLVSYYDAVSNTTYYNLSSTINTLSGVADDTATPEFSTFEFNNAIVDGNTLSAGTGWTPAAVPEPATGALALAGLALLFRRKRA